MPRNFPPLLLALVGLLLTGCFDNTLTAPKRALLVTAHDYRDYGAVLPEDFSGEETFVHLKQGPLGETLRYEYDSERGDPPLWISAELTLQRLPLSGRKTFNNLRDWVRWGIEFGDVTVREVPLPAVWGDEQFFAVLEYDGEVYGNFYVGRDGNRVLQVLSTGLYFDEGDVYAELLAPHQRAISDYDLGWTF